MPNVDWPLEQLRRYRPESTATADFDAFWEEALRESAGKPLNERMTLVDYPAKHVDVYDVVYDGIDGTPVHGWYVVPKEALAAKPMPVVVRYHGYNGDRGQPNELLRWAVMGVAAFSVDTRGQGGLTPDIAQYPSGGISGWMTLGLTDPNRHYYRYAYMDCVRALDFVSARPELDRSRIAVFGGSQGGGLALAVAGIDPRPKLAMPTYPYLCDFRRSVEQHGAGPYNEIKQWFRRYDPQHLREDDVYRTLSYFDGMNHAARVQARTMMAITLQDVICPPSSCFAAYNHLPGEKELRLYHDYGHEGLPHHEEELLRFVFKHL